MWDGGDKIQKEGRMAARVSWRVSSLSRGVCNMHTTYTRVDAFTFLSLPLLTQQI